MPLFKKKKAAEEEVEDGGGVAVNGDPEEVEDSQPENGAEDETTSEGADETSKSKDNGSAGDSGDKGGDDEDSVNGEAEDDDQKKKKEKKPKKEKAPTGVYDANPDKARRFFEHAETVSETRNYDYAIECYINGLRHDPDNMIRHEALREIALRRKVSGGKAAKWKEKLGLKAKNKIDKVLRAETLWSKDPLNLQRSIEVMQLAVEAEEEYEDLHMAEMAYWVGQLIMEKNETEKPPTKSEVLKIRDLFSEVGAWQESVNATRQAMLLAPDDLALAEQLKDLEAELAIGSGGYNEEAREAVRDRDEVEALYDETGGTDAAVDRNIERARDAYEDSPTDDDLRLKLIKALAEKDSDESENEAIEHLTELVQKTENQRHKLAIGDITMKQMARHLRQLKKEAKTKKDPEALKQYKALTRKRLEFELLEFTERAKNYPTDRKWRYELGRRMFLVKRYDDAITNFQTAKEDLKYRAAAHNYLGQCYLIQKWYDEAIDTLRTGLEGLPDLASDLAMDIQWYLMKALVSSSAENRSVELAKEAQKVASQILQTDINYRKIRDVIEQIRTLVKKLQARQDDD